LNGESNTDVCLIVKDLDKKSREYENTTVQYEELLSSKKLKSLIKQVNFELFIKDLLKLFI